jgi:two-component system, OmpR family, sensor histidine kinase MprB
LGGWACAIRSACPPEAMSLRYRLALVSAAGVGIALVLAALICYVVVRHELRGQVDDSLRAQAARIAGGDLRALGDQGMPAPSPRAGGPAQYWQIVAADGRVAGALGGVRLPFDSTAWLVANGRRSSTFEDIHVDGSHLRMLALGVSGGVVELARPLDAVDRVAAKLRLILLLICVAGAALAAALSRFAARRVLTPLADVANTAQFVSETEDLSQRIAIRSDDEVGQLADRFNTMLDRLQTSRSALDRSVRDQRQLVADASHELRTPVTSLRTNVEILRENPHLGGDERDQLLADVVEQSEELTTLVASLIELARETPEDAQFEPVRLDELVEDAVARARRNTPTVAFDAKLEPLVVDGVPERLIQAVNNLLDNAAHHSPTGEVVQISLSADGLRVRDHGSGVDPGDLPYIFDRFYRGTNSRSRPGSGLGLAIVRQVVEQHKGTVTASNAPDGGAILTISLPNMQTVEDQRMPSETSVDAPDSGADRPGG